MQLISAGQRQVCVYIFLCFYYVHSLQDTEATRAAFWAANPNSYEVNGVVMSPEAYYQTATVQEERRRWVWLALYKEIVSELKCVHAKINGIRMLLGRARAKRMLREIPHLIADQAAVDQAAADQAFSNQAAADQAAANQAFFDQATADQATADQAAADQAAADQAEAQAAAQT